MFPRPYPEGTVQPVIAPVHGDFCQLQQGVQMPIVIVALLHVLDHANDILPQVGKAFDKRFRCKPAVRIHIFMKKLQYGGVERIAAAA